MSEALRASIEAAVDYETQEKCLDYIAQMGA